MFDATRVLGSAVRRVYEQDGPSFKAAGIDFNASMIFGGQIKGEAMRLFMVYSAGNFIEATRETCFYQVGESKYGKPILDRVLTPATPLDEAAKCALVSMDSTLKSNLSVGLPLDLLVYREGDFCSDHVVCIDEHNPYFRMIRSTWGQRLHEVFEGIDDPRWDGGDADAPADGALAALRADAQDHPARRAHRLTAGAEAGAAADCGTQRRRRGACAASAGQSPSRCGARYSWR